MEGNQKKKQSNAIMLGLGIIIIIYIIYTAILLIYKPTDIYVVEYGELLLEEEIEGYIIRDEVIISGKDYENGMEQIILEGEKVGKEEPVFRYYSENEQWLIEKIADLDREIQEAMPEENSIYSFDMKILDSEIDAKIRSVSNLTSTSELTEYKKSIDEIITKKSKIVGENSEAGSYLKMLIEERKEYEEELNSNGEYINSTRSGIVSYRIDGLEEELMYEENMFAELSIERIQELNLKSGQIVPISTTEAKIIDAEAAYIILISDSENANDTLVGNKIELTIYNSQSISGEIVYKIEENAQNLMVVKVKKEIDKMLEYRKADVDIVWWKDSGLKVPNEAIIERDGLHYVIRNRAGYFSELLVKIEGGNETYSLVSSYDSDELNELGYSITEIQSMKKIAVYDEIVVNASLHTQK